MNDAEWENHKAETLKRIRSSSHAVDYHFDGSTGRFTVDLHPNGTYTLHWLPVRRKRKAEVAS